MGFEQDPDYEYLRGLFKNVMNSQGITQEIEFDWTTKLYGGSTNSPVDIKLTFCRISEKRIRL
jgi:hypothetical protein